MLTAAIIGCGDIAGGFDDRSGPPNVLTHAGAYAACADAVRLAAACDPSEEARRSFLACRPGVRGYEDPAAMFAAVRPDIVSVCSPTPWHERHVALALESGARAVICEKPLAKDAATATAMLRECQRRGVLLCVPYLRRWAPHFTALGRDIAEGRYGGLQAVTVAYTKGLRHNASHFVDLLGAWCGDWCGPTVFCGESWGGDDAAADFAVMFGTVRAMFLHLRAGCYEVLEMQLFFEEGRVDVLRGGREFRRHAIATHPVLRGGRILASPPVVEEWTQDRNMAHMLRNVLEALAGTRPLAAQPEEAVRALALCDAVIAALKGESHG